MSGLKEGSIAGSKSNRTRIPRVDVLSVQVVEGRKSIRCDLPHQLISMSREFDQLVI